MLSIEECRKIMGEEGKDLSDQRIQEIRDSLYKIEELILERYFNAIRQCSD